MQKFWVSHTNVTLNEGQGYPNCYQHAKFQRNRSTFLVFRAAGGRGGGGGGGHLIGRMLLRRENKFN